MRSHSLPSVLLVDDEEGTRLTFGFLLQAEGYDVTLASDGHTALAFAAERRYDVILVDQEMPLLSGIEVIARLTAAGCTSIKILRTAFPTGDIREQAVHAGAAAFVLRFQSPVPQEDLRKYLESAGIQDSSIAAGPAPDGVRRTPILIVFDRSGRIVQSWEGRLNSRQEQAVLRYFGGEG